MLIIRSSSSNEDIRNRGKYLSQEIQEPNIEKVLSCINSIFSNAINENGNSGTEFRLALIFQEFKYKKLHGHLSNERRVARRVQDWVYEFSSGKVGNFAIKSHYKNADANTPLNAGSSKALISVLRNVAAYFDDLQQRRHIEWVWDSNNVWLVQGDRDIDSVRTDPTSILSPNYPIQHNLEFEILRHWSKVDQTKWEKVSNQMQFKQAGIPTYPLWVIDNPQILNNIVDGKLEPIINDLNKLAQYPIVIRTDIDKKYKQSGETMDLPRSNTLDSLEKVQDFLVNIGRKFRESYKPEDYCFIFHQYIPSKSSAFSLSRKKNPRVLIDSLW